jgi:hypothetical protein
MKKIIFSAASLFLLLAACKEEQVVIPELSVGNRRIIVEEVTGVGCTNCPDGARELAAAQEIVGEENLILVGIHAGNVGGGNFSTPLSSSKYDFQTQDGYDLVNNVGSIFAVPSAAISRYEDPLDLTPWLIDGWTARITQELTEDYKLGLFVNNTFDPLTRKLDIQVNITPEKTIDGAHRITVMITQDSIVDPQKDGLETIPNYVHRHVLRDIVTNATGDDLNASLIGGQVITRNYSLTLPATWVEKHCSVVAFVHGGNGNPFKEALQAAEAKALK